MPSTSPRARSGLRDLVDREVRGVGGEDCARLGNFIDLAEHLLLDGHGLEDRLDDKVGVL
jgi:hypothetical protein